MFKTGYNPKLGEYAAQATARLIKRAVTPMPGGAPPMDPSMMGAGPMPPIMGGAPMDPSMMGGAPPMDPSMMGGAPPMDPSMMGGDMGLPPEEDPVAQKLDEIISLLQSGGVAPAGDKTSSGRVTNAELEQRLTSIEDSLSELSTVIQNVLGGPPSSVDPMAGSGDMGAEPVGDIGAPAMGMPPATDQSFMGEPKVASGRRSFLRGAISRLRGNTR